MIYIDQIIDEKQRTNSKNENEMCRDGMKREFKSDQMSAEERTIGV